MQSMQRVLNLIKTLFTKKQAKEAESAEQLRNAFKGRYHAFKLLLNANNRALDVMAEMGEALKGNWPFGMNFVRSRCTRVSTDVFQIVKNLNDLTPEKYKALFSRFKEIQMRINPFIRPKSFSLEGPFTIPMEQVDKSTTDQVGSKLANLGEIRKQFSVHVPKGYAITARAYEHFMKSNDLQEEIDRRIQSADVSRLDQLYSLSASIQQLIIGSPVPEDLATIISEQFQALEKEGEGKLTVALRSSALGEDLPGTSFAGQYRSELNVSRESLLQAYKEVVASKYSLTAMSYRLNRGIRDEDVAMCVGCLQMVNASSGGVMYSRNPVQIRDDSVIINAIWGLPKSVVDGSLTPDVFLVSRGEPLTIRQKQIAVKDQKFVCYPDEGVCRLDITGEESRMPSLSDEQALDLARLAVRLEEYYRSPQDIEWAVAEDGTIILLQCRPLQQLDEGKGRSQRGAKRGGSGDDQGRQYCCPWGWLRACFHHQERHGCSSVSGRRRAGGCPVSPALGDPPQSGSSRGHGAGKHYRTPGERGKRIQGPGPSRSQRCHGSSRERPGGHGGCGWAHSLRRQGGRASRKGREAEESHGRKPCV